LYNRVFKNYQINVGNPFQIKATAESNTLKLVRSLQAEEEKEEIYKSSVDIEETISEEYHDDLIAKAREEAERIMEGARLEAEELIREAQEELERLKVSVEEKAKAKGYEDGINEGRKKYEKLIKEAEMIKEKAEADYIKAMDGIEADAVDIIIDIAKKVISTEIRSDRGYILNLYKEAVRKCTSKGNIVLRVSAEDYDIVESRKSEILSVVEGLDNLDIKKDLSLKEGSCLVETQFGSVDAGIQTKIEKIEKAFRQTLGR